jgi:Rha family phage regulatory protein
MTNTQITINPEVSIINATPMVSSLNIASVFGKSHSVVNRSICNLQNDLETVAGGDSDFSPCNFAQSDYIDERGKTQPMYLMNRDAFSLLVMGFTGKRALEWKLKYISAFNAMERELTTPATHVAKPSNLRPTDAIMRLLNEICEDAEVMPRNANNVEIIRQRKINVQRNAAEVATLLGSPSKCFKGGLIPQAAYDIITGKVAAPIKAVTKVEPEAKQPSQMALYKRASRERIKQKQLEAA